MGRKKGLSLYRSKAAIKRKNEDNTNDSCGRNIYPNYTKIVKSNDDEEVNVLDDGDEDRSANSSFCDSGDCMEVQVTDSVPFQILDYIPAKQEQSFQQECIETLQNKNLLTKLVTNLDAEGNLEDFVNLIKQLANGDLPCNNIVLLLLLDRVRFQQCGNTVGMRYRNITKLFWSIVYRLCKGVGLKFFSGSKNWGQVVAKESGKSKYSPQKSKINFAVPDEKVLRDLNCSMPKVIPPGKIRCTMEMLRDKQDIILMGDAKLVTKGLKKDFSGDINLFGHEINPKLDDLKKYMDRRIQFVSDCIGKYVNSRSCDKFNIISDLADLITEMIQRVRTYYINESQKLLRFSNSKLPSKPDKAISACKTNIYTASIWVLKSLKLNDELFKMLCTLQKNSRIRTINNKIYLKKCGNLRLLHDSEYVCSEINMNEYPHLVRKYSDQWKEMLKESIIPYECIADSLGMNGTKKLNEYVKKHLKQEGDLSCNDLQHKTNYEVDGIATVANILMPALLPSCAIMYEEGCSFIRSDNYSKFLMVSPMAVIR